MRTLMTCTWLLTLAPFVHGQSLGEVAERAKAQREAGGAAKTVTQDDVDRAARAREAETKPGSTPSATPPPEVRAAQPEESGAAVLDEKIRRWRERYSKVQVVIETLEQEIARLEKEESDPRTVVLGLRIPSRRPRILEAQAELEKRQQERDEIVEQARLDGVASGQLY